MEQDMMVCRSCGNEERASEGYPCQSCGTFICLICDTRGIQLCKKCRGEQGLPEPANLPQKKASA
ncbi:MAG: hypothetical protein A2085_02465 [Gemmatimonadetes bacterium GWC2_71_10]|nr:MAG: hypothetical protein A2085_02465 [Gemmatimonadetes bacterium GWC2_71_10]